MGTPDTPELPVDGSPPQAVTPAAQRRRTETLPLAVTLAILTVLVYLPSLNNRFVNWDDMDYVTGNPYLAGGLTRASVEWSFRAFYASNWHPLTWISHAADISLYGYERVWGHHLTSVLLHALSAMVLLLALAKLTGRPWASAVVAGLFAVHPLHVESVSWVSERKDVLCGLFIFLAMWAHAWYAARPSWRRYLAVLGAAAGALLSKPMAVTLPMVLLVLDFWPLRRLSWRAVAEKAPLLAMVGAASVATWLAQGKSGAISSLEGLPFAARVGNAAYAYLMYVAEAFWPVPGLLVPFHPTAEHGGPSPGGLQTGLTILALAAVTAAAIWQRRRRPYLLAGWLIYAGMLVPVCGLVQVGRQIMADRYTYVPLLGVFLAVVWLAQDALGPRPRLQRASLGIAAVLLAGLGWLTWGQQAVWRNTETLWSRVLQAYPKCHIAWGNLGLVYAGQDPDRELETRLDLPKAEHYLRTAIGLAPTDFESQSRLGAVLTERGMVQEAEEHFRRAIEIFPGYAEGHFNYGVFLLKRRRPIEAVEQFRLALAIDPSSVQAMQGIAEAQKQQSKPRRP